MEDDPIIAMDMAYMVETAGFAVVGPAYGVAGALELIEATRPDAGVLDINLGHERSWPIARALGEMGVPFVLASGYSRVEIEPEFQSAPLLTKPILEAELMRGLREIGLLAAHR